MAQHPNAWHQPEPQRTDAQTSPEEVRAAFALGFDAHRSGDRIDTEGVARWHFPDLSPREVREVIRGSRALRECSCCR